MNFRSDETLPSLSKVPTFILRRVRSASTSIIGACWKSSGPRVVRCARTTTRKGWKAGWPTCTTACTRERTVGGVVETGLDSCRVLAVAGDGVFRGGADVETADIRGTLQGPLRVRGILTVRASARIRPETLSYGKIEIERGGIVAGTARRRSHGAIERPVRRSGARPNTPARRRPGFRQGQPRVPTVKPMCAGAPPGPPPAVDDFGHRTAPGSLQRLAHVKRARILSGSGRSDCRSWIASRVFFDPGPAFRTCTGGIRPLELADRHTTWECTACCSPRY